MGSRLLAHVPAAYAASKEDPLGAGSDSGSARDDAGGLSVTATDPNGNPVGGSGAPIYRGETITVTLSYTVAHPSGSTWDAWMNFDNLSLDGCSDPTNAGTWGAGCLENQSGSSTSQELDDAFDTNGGDNGNVEQNDNCPSFYDNSDSPYADTSQETNGTTPLFGLDFPWSGGSGTDGHSTCGTEGWAAVWHGVHMDTVGQKNYSVTYHVNPDFGAANQQLCVSGDITLGDVQGLSNNSGDLYYRTNANSLCLTVNVPTTISGNVQSDPYASTGKKFGSQTNIVSVSANCQYNDINSGDGGGYVSTDGSGAYSFGWFQGQPFCIGPNTEGPNAASAYTWVYDGTTYINVQPPSTYSGASGLANDPPNGSNPNTWSTWTDAQSCGPGDPDPTHCGGYNIYWLAGGNAPNITKTEVSPGNGANLTPGEAVTYSVTLDNPYDYNINYGGGNSVGMDDYVPNNIDPTTTGGPSYSIGGSPDPTGSVPGGWSVSGVIPCYSISYGLTGHQNLAGAGCTAPNSGVEGVAFTILPAYSSVTMTWTGTVKTAADIGVYPEYFQSAADQAHAQDPNCNAAYGDATGLMPYCEDFTNGLEGVYNVAGYLDQNGNWTPSNSTYNPIPAAVDCLSKYAVGLQQDDSDTATVNSCSSGTQPQYYAYVSGRNDYNGLTNGGAIEIQVTPDPNQGPLFYQLYDQSSTQGLDPNITVQPVSSPLMTNGVTAGCSSGCGGGAGPVVGWAGGNGEELYGSGAEGSYTIPITLANSTTAIGGRNENTSDLCIIQYWASGHPLNCNPATEAGGTSDPSVPIYFTHYDDLSPYLTTSGGDVHAGGCNQDTTTGQCATQASSVCPSSDLGNNAPEFDNTVFNNNPDSNTIGQYLVTAGDNLSGNPYAGTSAGVLSGSSNLSTANDTGVIIRPNLCGAATAYAAKQGGTIIAGAGVLNAGGQNGPSGSFRDDPDISSDHSGLPAMESSPDSKVITADPPSGTYTLGSSDPNNPATIEINHRWTLYVTGNLYINANISYGSNNPTGTGLNAEQNHPSFGVIATGNIYIGKDVTNLSGFYTSAGVINTCADVNGSSLSYQVGGGGPGPGSGSYTTTDCADELTVQGIMYADTFRFNRTTGYNTTTPTVSESIDYDNRLYTATPPAFNDLVGSSLLSKYLIEPLPRY
ncbi:MAG TPA: hypothetical protein VMR75_01000 [Candidatus Saccharimonadales bacterium]|nr:hypothetical protein [Candidatus Saccharimonadales bacterium]